MLWPVALSFGAKSIDIMVTGMYYLSGGYLPGGNYVQIIFARLLKEEEEEKCFLIHQTTIEHY